jgi:hypothetical protein
MTTKAKPEDQTTPPEVETTDLADAAQTSVADAGQPDPDPDDAAANPAEATPAPAGEADGAIAPDPVAEPLAAGPEADPIPDSDPPVDDRIAKGKGDKARAATLGQVAAPKPKPAKEDPEAETTPAETTIDTRIFPGPALAFGGRARRRGWAPGYELTAQNASDRTGRKMQLMTTGARSGPIEWKPAHLADELMADDWQLTIPNDQLELMTAVLNGEAAPGVKTA